MHIQLAVCFGAASEYRMALTSVKGCQLKEEYATETVSGLHYLNTFTICVFTKKVQTPSITDVKGPLGHLPWRAAW